ncbi:DUF5672 family protein [Pedobacter cryoconitis]|uniref:DUF5672 family protein n=1 Tax=Pedobacter cryoconitis TaxID=188932 RepID=UPI00161DEA88|nr:DUF5672 family protein [Pedobacter cryoconitis]MBB5648379.1 hypothetical protein [Pedobacter cryoconitis]
MNNTAAIIIPLYKPQLNKLEEISIRQCFKILSQHKIIAVKPQHLSLSQYGFEFDEVISFDDAFFQDIEGYNKLMLSSLFYEKFLAYTFILIYQPDAFVFRDDLSYWCNQGYDYIGAPWLRYTAYPDLIKRIKNQALSYLHRKKNTKQPHTDLPTDLQFENRVGNGGFSLRHTKKFHDICLEDQKEIEVYNSRPEHYFNEDVFWSLEVNRKARRLEIPGYKQAVHFAIENNYLHGFDITKGELPFGCHAWDRNLEFWKPFFEKAGVTIGE